MRKKEREEREERWREGEEERDREVFIIINVLLGR